MVWGQQFVTDKFKMLEKKSKVKNVLFLRAVREILTSLDAFYKQIA